MPHPHIGRASDFHKIIPLLCRWTEELLDGTARASVLKAVHFAISNLPAPEVRWHNNILAHSLMKMSVFREPEALRYLVPALIRSWPNLTSEHAVKGEGEAREYALELIGMHRE